MRRELSRPGLNPDSRVAAFPETYDVRADGELLVCEPADMLPTAQRYYLF